MFNPEQIKELLKNTNVDKCSLNSITYNKDFKLRSVKRYYDQGDSPNIIFEAAGFDLSVIGRKKPKDCLKRWRKIYNTKGEKALMRDNRHGPGRRAKTKEPDDIKYLKAKITYLEAENDFLAKLRGLKRN